MCVRTIIDFAQHGNIFRKFPIGINNFWVTIEEPEKKSHETDERACNLNVTILEI